MTPSVAVVTAPGRGAIAMVRAWGPGALAAVDGAFRPARGASLAKSPPGRPRFGRIGAGLGDEVVALIVGGDPPEVEVQCHGGPAAVALVVDALAGRGARVRPARAWARHAAGSSIRAEAAVELARASTLRAAEILLDQVEGALDDELRRAIESGPAEARAIVDRLIERSRVGVRLVDGWTVALAGRPNVGKSRLLNALSGYDRAIVDASPGTTRDVVTTSAAFGGWPVELADTAGLREPAGSIEAQGIDRARARQRAADLVVVVLDRSEPLAGPDRAVLADHPGALVVANKADLPGVWDESAVGALAISAERGDGVEALAARIADRLVPEAPPEGSGVPFLAGQVRRLRAIRDRLASGDRERAIRSLGRWIAPSGSD